MDQNALNFLLVTNKPRGLSLSAPKGERKLLLEKRMARRRSSQSGRESEGLTALGVATAASTRDLVRLCCPGLPRLARVFSREILNGEYETTTSRGESGTSCREQPEEWAANGRAGGERQRALGRNVK